MNEHNQRKPYSTDLTDAQWKLVEPLLPQRKSPRGRKRVHPLREMVNAIFYVLRTGCAWRLLPHDFPHWKTVYHYFRLWRRDGTWERINAVLRTKVRNASGRASQPSVAIIDSQSVKTTEEGGLVVMMRARRSKGASVTCW